MLTGHSGLDSTSPKAALRSEGRPLEDAVWKYTRLHSETEELISLAENTNCQSGS